MAVILHEGFRKNNAGEVCGFEPETEERLVATGKARWFQKPETPAQPLPPPALPPSDPPKRKGFLRTKQGA